MAIGGLVFAQSTYTTRPDPIPMPTQMNWNFREQVEQCFIPVAKAYGYTLRITDGWRSMEEQDLIYEQGRTVNGHIVTEAPAASSTHVYGYAVDITDRFRGYNINWKRLVGIGGYCGLENGGEGDLPHFEYRGGLGTADFAKGRRPPLLSLPCALMAERAKDGKTLALKDLAACGAPKF